VTVRSTSEGEDIEVRSSVEELSVAAGDSSVDVTYVLVSTLSEPVELDTRETVLERDGIRISERTEAISAVLVPGDSLTLPHITVRIDCEAALRGDSTARCELTTTFSGTKAGGGRAFGSVSIPVTVTTAAAADTALAGEELVLIPNVALVRPTSETTITSGSQVLDGPGILVLLPSPFDSLEVPVTFFGLTFAPDSTHHDSMRVTGGRLDGATEGGGDLFTLYYNLFRAKRISFDAVRDPGKELRLDEAHVDLPGREPLVIDDIIINENGMSLEDIDLEYTVFGLTLRIIGIETGEEDGASTFLMTVRMRLQGRPRREEFCTTTLKLTEGGGVECRAEPEPEPFQIIPGHNYLLLEAVEFGVHPDSIASYAGFTVSLNYPPPLEDLGPTEFTFRVNEEGEAMGEVVVVRDEGDEESDRTRLDFGGFATFDLTYAALRLVCSGDGFDYEHSFVALSGDFIFHESADRDYRIGFGDEGDDPGVRINFDGSVEWHDLMLARDRRVDMGPVYIRLNTLGFEFEPRFAFVLSGGLGVDRDEFSGELVLETLKVFSDGSVDFDHMVVRGGNLSVMNVVTVGVEDFDYCDDDCEITCRVSSGEAATDTTLEVDSFFRMVGAEVNIGEDGRAGSGSFRELLVYSSGGEDNFVLRQAEIEIADRVEVTVDLRYLVGHPTWGDILSLAGHVEIDKEPSPITGDVYGKIGTTVGGEATWGIFLAAGGLNIQIGPVTLDELGGGFFYNPIPEDLAMVRELCDIDRPEITAKVDGPDGRGYPGSFAAMMYGGIFVMERDLVRGRALLTITERNVALDASVEVLDGKGEGACYLEVGWAPSYVEGNFTFELDLYSLIGADAELMIYVYDEDTWAVMGDSELQVIPCLPLATVEAGFFIGPPGFLLDLSFEAGFDVGILSAHAGFENMYWWNRNVSWGAYMKIYADGEILWGLVGVEGTLEGALLGTDEEGWLIYCVGSFYAELFWVTVFDGSIWMTLSGDGLDGGEGRNARYDELIEDARNMADRMREDMEELAGALEDAVGALGELSGAELAAAGMALIRDLGGSSTEAVELRRRYEEDANSYPGRVPADVRAVLLGVKAEVLEDEAIGNIVRSYNGLQGDRDALSVASGYLSEKHRAVVERMEALGEVITGELPSVRDAAGFVNPVGALRFETVNIGGRSVRLQTGFELDEAAVAGNVELAGGLRDDIEEYQRRVFEAIEEYEDNLRALDEFMGPSEEPEPSDLGSSGRTGEVSPNELSRQYAQSFAYMNGFFERYLSLINDAPGDLISLSAELEARRADIQRALESQADALNLHQARELAGLRREFIDDLLVRAGRRPKGDWDDPEDGDLDGWRRKCVERGMDIWYAIPDTGFHTFGESLREERGPFTDLARTCRSAFVSDWVRYTNGLNRVHDRRARLYELLYDLYDQLSLSATRYPPSATAAFVREVMATTASGGGAAPGVAAARGTSVLEYPDTPRGYFARKRDQLMAVLTVPRITGFTGSASSSCPDFAHVSLEWSAVHPAGIADVSYRIVGPPAEAGSGVPFRMFVLELPWRTVGPWAESTGFALISPFDREGSYTVYLRVTGAGGYSVTRQGLIEVSYGEAAPFSSSLSSTDDTPPTRPVVEHGGDFTRSTGAIYASWRSSDPESGIEEYRYRVVTTRVRTEGKGRWGPAVSPARVDRSAYVPVTDWASAGGMRALNVRHLSLSHGRRYYVEVKAKNGAGLWSAVGRSDGVLVDTSAASRPTVAELLQGEFPEAVVGSSVALPASAVVPSAFTTASGSSYRMRAVSSAVISYSEGTDEVPPAVAADAGDVAVGTEGPYPNTISASWSASSDPESGVTGYRYALGTGPGATDLLDWTYTDRRTITVEDLPISHGDTCYFMVRSVNGAGALSPADTASLVVEYADTTAPVAAPHVLASYDPDTDSLTVFWYGDGGDPESGIVEYRWAIGHSATEAEAGTLIQDWTSAGKERRVEVRIHLPGGTVHYVKVKAINGVGLYRVGFSRPIRTPTSPVRRDAP